MTLQPKAIQSVTTFPALSLRPLHWNLNWAYATKDKRDLRLDLLRGFAVFVMVVDHFGGSSWLYLVTGGNAFFTSGAEAFVFISGLVVGMVYGSIAQKESLRAAQNKLFLRALTLYKLTVVLTLLFAALSFSFGLPWADGSEIGNPLTFTLDVLLLRRTMYLVDIPLMYSLLLLLAPLGLWLLVTKRSAWLAAASVIVWTAFQLFPAQVHLPWQIVGNTTFNLAAWQLLFFGAMIVGYHRDQLTAKLSPVPRLPYLLLTGTLFIYLIHLRATNGAALSWAVPGVDPQALMAELFQKSALAPGRLIASFIVFQFAYLAATLLWKPIYAALGWLLLPLGQSALYCYSMHVGVIGSFYALLPHLPVNVSAIGEINSSLQMLTVLLIWMMVQRKFLFRIVPR